MLLKTQRFPHRMRRLDKLLPKRHLAYKVLNYVIEIPSPSHINNVSSLSELRIASDQLFSYGLQKFLKTSFVERRSLNYHEALRCKTLYSYGFILIITPRVAIHPTLLRANEPKRSAL